MYMYINISNTHQPPHIIFLYTRTLTHSAVECIVKSHPEHVNVRDNLRCTPLHIAASEGEVEVAKTILDVVRMHTYIIHACTLYNVQLHFEFMQ